MLACDATCAGRSVSGSVAAFGTIARTHSNSHCGLMRYEPRPAGMTAASPRLTLIDGTPSDSITPQPRSPMMQWGEERPGASSVLSVLESLSIILSTTKDGEEISTTLPLRLHRQDAPARKAFPSGR